MQPQPKAPIRVAMVDDHVGQHWGLSAYLEGQADLEWAGAARLPGEATDLLAAVQPDVLVLDLHFGREHPSGMQLAEALLREHPALRIVIYSAHLSFVYEQRLRALGIMQFVDKGVPMEELAQAIRCAMQPDLAECAPQPKSDLTPAQVQVLELARLGMDNRGIAARLGKSAKTVEKQFEALHRYFAASTRHGMLLAAQARGIIPEVSLPPLE